MTFAKQAERTTRLELREGVNGSGNTVYMVVTVDNATERYMHTEKFSSKSEAECWMKYA